MGLEIVILSEVSQTEKEKYHMISLICGIERVTGMKARGPQVAGGNKLQVADVSFLLHIKLKEASFNSVLRTPGSALS